MLTSRIYQPGGTNGGHTYIRIGPWGFTQKMIELFLNDEPRIAELSTHTLGTIFQSKTKVTPTLVRDRPFDGTTGGLGCLFLLFRQIRLPAAAQDLRARVVA